METKVKTKVLYVITKSNWGGAQRYVYDLATHLDTEQFEPVVALGGDGPLKAMLLDAGIRVISIGALTRDISLKQEWVLFRELWSIFKTEKPDVLHVNSSKAGGLGSLIGRLTHVPRIIFTAHGWAFNEDRPWWQRLIIKSFHWLTILLSHHTIAVSHGLIKQMDWPLVKRKMSVIHPGRTVTHFLDRKTARNDIVSRSSQLALYADDRWVLSIAELHPIKRLGVLIEAFSIHIQTYPNSRLILIGDGSEHNTLERQISALSLSSHVFLLGSITEAAQLLKAADIFVLPSKSESYGYVLHEAGLACLPVIATNVGGIPDIVEHEHSGLLIEPDSIPALTDALNSLYTDLNGAQKYATNLYTKMRARSVYSMVQSTLVIYLNLDNHN